MKLFMESTLFVSMMKKVPRDSLFASKKFSLVNHNDVMKCVVAFFFKWELIQEELRYYHFST